MMNAARYAADLLLDDGGLIQIRAIRPDDKARLVDAHRRLSERSVYYRFFTLKRCLSPEELVYLTEVDFEQHVALVATVSPFSEIEEVDFGFASLELDGEFILPPSGREPEGGESGEQIIGVGRYVVQQPGSAEVAITVTDAHQRRGIGAALLQHLVKIARAAEIETFEADVLAENEYMHRALMARCGLPVTFTPQRDTVHMTVSLAEGGCKERR